MNVNIAMTISNRLRKKGNIVYSVTKKNDDNEISKTNSEAFDKVFPVQDIYYDSLKRFQSDKTWENKTAILKLVDYLSNPGIIPAWLDSKFSNGLRSLKKNYLREIDYICKNNTIDVVIAFSEPHWTEEIISSTKCNVKKAIFQLDPYIYLNFVYGKDVRKRIIDQKKTVNGVDKIFVTAQGYDEILENIPEVDKSKLIKYIFPGVKVENNSIDIARDQICKENSDKINIFFIGTLYDDIRNPEYVLELFSKLDDKYLLNIVGGGCDRILDDYSEKLGDRLIRHGRMSPEEAYCLMSQADILLNIGNTIQSLTPSKIFDYINTGKPIINICKLTECPSLPYFNKYPLCYTIFEKDGITDDIVRNMRAFIDSSSSKIVPKDEILQLYRECTDDYVSDQIVEAFL